MNRSPLLILAAALLAVLACTATAQSTNEATRFFLQQMADHFPSQLSSWTGSNYCSGSWEGISCDASGYVTMDLSGRGLEGKLPVLNFVGNNVKVRTINLSNNKGLYGRFPIIWSGLTQLENLDLSDTSLDHSIPDGWNGMVSLKTVKISNTYACGGLPNWAMKSLTDIDLSNNKMGGMLAYSWSTLSNLRSVNIAGNNFCGCEPVTWKINSPLLHEAAPASSKADNCLTNIPCWAKEAFECPTNTDIVPDDSSSRPNSTGTVSAASGVASSLLVVVSVLTVLATMIRV